METTDSRPGHPDPAGQLRALERSEALPYVFYPKTPLWYPPTQGLLVAATILIWASLFLDWNAVLFSVAAVVYAGSISALIAFVRTRYGAFPRPFGKGTPPEIRSLYWRYLVGCALVVAIVALVWWWVGPYVSAAAAFVLVTAGLAAYETAYLRVAAVVRLRLGIEPA